MSTDKHIQEFGAGDIERYHQGLMSGAERHALEKAALEDPFLAEALEGYRGQEAFMANDLAELKQRLAEKAEEKKIIPLSRASGSFPWLRAAAVLVLLAGAGYLSYNWFFQKDERSLAQETTPAAPVITDTPHTANIPVFKADSLWVATGREQQESVNLTIKNSAREEKVVADSISQATSPESKLNDLALEKQVAPVPNSETSREKAETQPAAAPTVAARGNKPGDTDGDGVPDQFDRKRAAANNANNGYLSGAGNLKYATPYLFRGRVTDANGNALGFAKIANVRDNVGTYTDARGNFVLTSTDSLMTVQVRSLGYNNARTVLNKSLTENRIVLQDDNSISEKILDSSKVNYARRSRTNQLNFEEPEPADGWASYDAYLVNNINVPDNIEKQKKTSSPDVVEVSFEVNEVGEPVNFRIEKSLCAKCDQEAIRLIREGPKWKRKARKGRTTVTIPFNP